MKLKNVLRNHPWPRRVGGLAIAILAGAVRLSLAQGTPDIVWQGVHNGYVRYTTFSPDGQQLAFSKNGKLFRASVAGGALTEIAEGAVSAGLYWGADNYLYFSSGLGSAGIWRVAVGGGRLENVTTVRDADRENGHLGSP